MKGLNKLNLPREFKMAEFRNKLSLNLLKLKNRLIKIKIIDMHT